MRILVGSIDKVKQYRRCAITIGSPTTISSHTYSQTITYNVLLSNYKPYLVSAGPQSQKGTVIVTHPPRVHHIVRTERRAGLCIGETWRVKYKNRIKKKKIVYKRYPQKKIGIKSNTRNKQLFNQTLKHYLGDPIQQAVHGSGHNQASIRAGSVFTAATAGVFEEVPVVAVRVLAVCDDLVVVAQRAAFRENVRLKRGTKFIRCSTGGRPNGHNFIS